MRTSAARVARVALVAIGLVCGLGDAAHAQLQVYVWPAKFELALPAGAAESRQVEVANTGARPVTVRAYTSDWWYTADAYKRFAPAGTFPRSSASWISLESSSFELEPGKKRIFSYTVAIPRDAKGGHYAVLFFDVRPTPPKDGKGLVLRFGGRVGVLIAQFDPRTSKPQMRVAKTTVQAPTAVDPLELALTIENTGNVHIVPQARATVVSKADKQTVGHFALESRPQYLPGQRGQLTGVWSKALPPGEYELLTTISYFASKATVKRTAFTVK